MRMSSWPEVSAVPQTTFILLRLFSRRWLLATLLVLLAAGVMARLGVWQLDRLAQRRAFNARLLAQINQPALTLQGTALDLDLAAMEYRAVIVRGVYDFSHQVALRNQVWGNQPGVRLLTPLRIEGSQRYVLVDRGWVPLQGYTDLDWTAYDEPGLVEVRGVIRASQSKPDFGRRSDPTPAPGQAPLRLWFFANVEAIAAQMPYPLLPIYIQQADEPTHTTLPYRSLPQLDLSEGPHLSYAIQWFTFSVMLLLGYPLYVYKRERR